MKVPMPEVRSVPVDQIKPWDRNPRKNHAVDIIAGSIESFGYLAPIILQKNTNRVLAGHGRLEALKKKGVTEVPCILADIDDDRADMYTVTDNKLTELAEWDFSTMADLLLEFDQKNLNTKLTGFDDDEIKKIMEWTPPALEGDDDPETKDFNSPPQNLESSHVKMVQLFLNDQTFPTFNERVALLSKTYGTTNLTDTVWECVKRAYDQAKSQPVG